MKISCQIAEDLLPLYLDNSCSEDSRAILEVHLEECPSCRAKMARMQSGIMEDFHVEKSTPELVRYARRVRKHRICAAVSVVFLIIAASFLPLMAYLTYDQWNPHVFEVEAGTYNLTTNDLQTTAEETGQYVLYTNNTKIRVTVKGKDSFQGTVMLWDAENSNTFIGIAEVNEKSNTCMFTLLSAARRYRITCDNLDGAAITVSDGGISRWLNER